jgi:hypothetical protein
MKSRDMPHSLMAQQKCKWGLKDGNFGGWRMKGDGWGLHLQGMPSCCRKGGHGCSGAMSKRRLHTTHWHQHRRHWHLQCRIALSTPYLVRKQGANVVVIAGANAVDARQLGPDTKHFLVRGQGDLVPRVDGGGEVKRRMWAE